MLPTKFQFILAEGFQRRLKCEKLTDDGRQMPSDGKSSHCLWQGELKSYNTHLSSVNFSHINLLLKHKVVFDRGFKYVTGNFVFDFKSHAFW